MTVPDPRSGPDDPSPYGSFGRRFASLFLLGMIGVASLPLVILPMLQAMALPEEVAALPLPVLAALSLINPVLLLAVGTALGAWLVPKLGLVSLVVERMATGARVWPRLREAVPLAVGLGLALALVTMLLDAAFQPFLPPAFAEAAAGVEGPGSPAALAAGMLYGGITEEIVMRWGALSLFAWLGWRFVQQGEGPPRAGVMWGAVVLAALLFGLGHLPAVAALAPLDTALVVRTVGLNALAGIAFGWLFWRRHLEAAMVAHAAAHVGFALGAALGLA